MNIELSSCGLFDMDPTIGACMDIYFNYAYFIEIPAYKPVNGGIETYKTDVVLIPSASQTLKFGTASF